MQTLRYACAALVLVVGCDGMKNSPRPLAKTTTFELYVVSPVQTPSSKQGMDPDTNAAIFLTTPAIISAADVATIERSVDSSRLTSFTVNLTPAGAKKLAATTANPAGMQMAIVANGTVVAAPKVMAPLSTTFIVTGDEITEPLFEALTKN